MQNVKSLFGMCIALSASLFAAQAAQAKFLQTDPIGYQDQMNLYTYVDNDPLNKTDPSGEFGLVGAAVGAFVGTAVGAASYGLGQLATGQEITLGGLAGAAGGGFVTGGLIGLTGGLAGGGVLGAAAIGAGSNAVGSVVAQKIEGNGVDVGRVIISAVAGAAGGAGSHKVGEAITKEAYKALSGAAKQGKGTTVGALVTRGAVATDQVLTSIGEKVGLVSRGAGSEAIQKAQENLNTLERDLGDKYRNLRGK